MNKKNDGKLLAVPNIEGLTLDVVKSSDFSKAYANFAKHTEQVTEAKKVVDAKVKELMAEEYHKSGDKVVDTEEVRFSFVAGSVSPRFDTARFKAENPELYEKYCVKSMTSDSLRVKVK